MTEITLFFADRQTAGEVPKEQLQFLIRACRSGKLWYSKSEGLSVHERRDWRFMARNGAEQVVHVEVQSQRPARRMR